MLDLYGRVQSFANETIGARPLDAVGHVAHWGGAEVTLHETWCTQVDGSTGLLPQAGNLPDADWPVYVANLTALAERF